MSVTDLRHDAFVYDTDDEFVGQLAPFIRAGLADDAAVVAVVPPDKLTLLRNALGVAAEPVSFIDSHDWYSRPASALAGYAATLHDRVRAGAPSVRVIGEVHFGSTQEEWRAWAGYESILNHAFSDQPAWIVCPYDTRVLPEQVVEGAWHTHEQVLVDGWETNRRYREPEEYLRAAKVKDGALPELRALAPVEDPAALRERLKHELVAAEVATDKARDMLIAANEIAVNAWLHADGPRVVRVGSVGERFVCEISDRGAGFDNALAGHRTPDPNHLHGAGIWIARQLTWRLELLASPAGLTVRLWV